MPTANLAITKLGEATGLVMPAAALDGLAQQGIKTLADIRRQRGLPATIELAPEVRAKLEAHAYLSLVADDPQTSQKLIEGNIGHITAIAGMSKANFVQKAQTMGVSAEQAATIHAKAAATQAILHNVLTSARTELANDLRAPDKYGMDEFFARQGGYDERLSAVSPAAYLADLLYYMMSYANSGGLLGEYFDNEKFEQKKLERLDPVIEFHWQQGSPDPAIEPGTFSVRWTGFVTPLYSETYTFFTRSDDCVRLWIDDKLLINNWTPHAETENYSTIDLKAGQSYRIKLEYYQGTGVATIVLLWMSQNQPKEIIPTSQLSVYSTREVNIDFLPDKLHQSYRDLPLSPEEVDRKVRQIRLCVEVLRGDLSTQALTNPQFKASYQAYLMAAYRTLLNQIGTSFDEIRLVKTAPVEQRQALADRLGIHLSVQRPGELDDLDLDPKRITEADLERLFGLVDTTHDFRAERGHITGDPTRQIKAAVITGIVPGVSADERGTIYVTLTTEKLASGKNRVNVKLFRTAARKEPQDVVVWGESMADDIQFPIEITLSNTTNINYNVTGAFIIDHAETMPNANIAIEHGSALVAWRRVNLRQQWQAQDWPEDVYSQHTLPVIDPDLIGLDDMRIPYIGATRSLCQHRQQWVSQGINELRERKNTPLSLDAVFQRMYESVTYKFTVGEQESSYTPWQTPESQFDGLRKALTGGTTAEAMTAQQRIQNELKLTVASFTRLLEIRDKYLRWKNDPANPEVTAVTDAEWEEFFSILVQAQKACFYSAWCEEEQLLVQELAKLPQNQTEVLLSPKYFWLALHESELPRWRASAEARQTWQQTLRSRSQPPLLDPDLIDENDLAQPAMGKPLTLLTDRRQYLAHRKQLMNRGRAYYWRMWQEDWSFLESSGRRINPSGVAMDASGNVYAAESGRHRVLKFDLNGCVIQQWGGTASAADGQFTDPHGVAVDAIGNLYVADTGNHRIEKFNASGDFVTKWVAAADHPDDQFNYPAGIAVDGNGNLYVADTFNNRVQKLDANGGFVRQWGGQSGDGDGQFNAPSGVAIDGSGNLYVADTGNHRVQKFGANGVFLKKIGGTQGTGNEQFNVLIGIAINKKGDVYVADTGNGRIQIFSADLEFQNSLTGMRNPRWIAFNDAGNRVHSEQDKLIVFFGERTAELRYVLAANWASSFRELMTLVAERKQGNSISARLDQLGLSEAAFAYLVRAHDLLIAGEPLQDAEWDEVDNIAVQSLKQREFAAWRKEESDARITLSPDFFKIAETETIVLNRWRASAEARRAWQDKLRSRMDQDATLLVGLAEAVDACEEATLPFLRDALVAASSETAKALSDRLLIDFQVGPSLKTTRVSQAITTLQSLVFALRAGQPALWLTLADPDFEERWRWLGSYETWKAAVGVFLYPENILLPGLRPRSHQTPAFRQLAGQLLQSQYRFDAGTALNLAHKYMNYVNDIFRLDTKAAIYDSQGKRVYLFAIATLASKSVYFSSYDPHGFEGFAQTCWIPLSAFADKDAKPGNSSAVVEDILGAIPWYDEESFIYLFLKIRQGVHGKLAFVKYNLKTDMWDSELSPLELPQENARFSIAAGLSRQTKNPEPLIAISIDHKLYIRKIRRNSWEDGDWSKFEMDFEDENADPPKQFTSLLAMIPSGEFTFDIIAQGGIGSRG
ncbi:MAG: hypothetical protein DYG89_28915 [Caldilinea sp. CFX5]|nr:hypothetical protein [Caldilinea sp. CFX5]